MEDEKRFPNEKYYCKHCKMEFMPAFYPVNCNNCGSNKVIPVQLLKTQERNWSSDSTYFDYIMKNNGNDEEK